MNIGCIQIAKEDFVYGVFHFKAGDPFILKHLTEGLAYVECEINTGAAFLKLQINMQRSRAEALFDQADGPPAIPFDLDPSTWYAKKVELLRDVPGLDGTVIEAGTSNLEVVGFEGKDFLIGWRSYFKYVPTGEIVDDMPATEAVPQNGPVAICRVPVSLFWIREVRPAPVADQAVSPE